MFYISDRRTAGRTYKHTMKRILLKLSMTELNVQETAKAKKHTIAACLPYILLKRKGPRCENADPSALQH